MRAALLAAAALIALAGCGEKAADKGGNMSASEVADQLAAVKIEPGEWEATTEFVSAGGAGMPKDAVEQILGKKTSARHCVTPEQAARPDANFLAAQKNNSCTYQDFSMKDGRMTGTMTCQGGDTPGKTVMAMGGEYGSTSYDMTMDMTTSGLPGGMTMNVKARTTGRRIGDCT
jgi:uncharacterized protein DUF3617